jgi:PAS domain S-box-containing protein
MTSDDDRLDNSQHAAAALRAATLALTQTLDLDTVLATLLDQLARLIPYDTANVMLRVSATAVAMRASRGYERWTASRSYEHATLDARVARPIQVVIATHGSLLIPDTETYPGWQRTEVGRHVRSWIGVPLIDGGEVIGLYSLDKAEPHAFTAEHVRLAEALAAHAVVAIQNARLHEQLRAQARELAAANQALEQEIAARSRAEARRRFLAEAGDALAASLDNATTLENVMALLVPALCDWSALDLIGADGALERVAQVASDPAAQALVEELNRRYPPHLETAHPIARVLRTGVAEVVPEIGDEFLVTSARDADHLALLRAIDARSYVVAPLIARGRSIGVLTLTILDTTRRFDASDVEFATELAGRCALAVDNARLYNQARAAVQVHHESLALLNTLLASAPIGLAFHDRELRFVQVNHALARINGRPSEEHIGRTPADVIPELAPTFEPILRRVIAAGEPIIDVEIDGVTPADPGAIRHWLASFYPVRVADGETLGVGTVVQDITERKRAADELRRQKEVFQHIIDNVPVMLGFVANDSFELVNHEWERVLGWSLEAMRGRDMLAEFYPDPVLRQEVLEYILAAKPGWREFPMRARDGHSVDVSWANVRLSDGTTICIGQDITERKRLEARFLQAQKMESVGRLAGGVAHDFNNLLTVITGFADMAAEALPRDHPARADLVEIRGAADRATSMTSQLLAFARKQIINPQVVRLNDLILNLDRMLRRLIGEDIDLALLLAPDLQPIKVDPHQIEQVLVNLVVNARDAMPSGGKLIVETNNVALDHAYQTTHAGGRAGQYVLLAVSDGGVGMDAQTLAHVFEPFFTTKGPGRGTGLGLSTCYGIVKQHGGYITIYSEPGKGTAVKVYLPAIEAPAEAMRPAREPLALPRGTETILLVEDELSVRSLVARILGRLGYTVVQAGNGAEALALLADPNGPRFDLLLTDVVMPRMGGMELAARLAELRPGTPVLFMSGYTGDAIVAQGHLHSGLMFIQKPFSQAVLAGKLREALGK